MKTLEVRLDDAVMADLETVCAEHHMDAAAAAGEAVRRYVAAERARNALGASDLISVYSEFSGSDLGVYASDEEEFQLS